MTAEITRESRRILTENISIALRNGASSRTISMSLALRHRRRADDADHIAGIVEQQNLERIFHPLATTEHRAYRCRM